jgi:two-component system sensor histidine kinase DesK
MTAMGGDSETTGALPLPRVWVRVGQLLGLTFLIGPLSDLADASESASRTAGIAAALAAFVAVYLIVLPPPGWLTRRGRRAIYGGLALLAALAALPLVLGAPRSFTGLFVYVVAAGGILLSSRAAAALTVITSAAVGAGLAAAGSDDSTVAAYVLTFLAVGTVMIALGALVRANRDLRIAREELARTAVSEERLRIARDLHDLLGHTLSLIALKAELAAKLVESDASRARLELEDVQNVAREGLAEVREAVHEYRLRSVGDAIEGARSTLAAAGIECRVDSKAGELPADIESVFAWAVREASTNVVRHSGAHACAITLARTAMGVSLQVDDDGEGSDSSAPGSGLEGLAERARRLHGTLEAGASPEGGFRLRLTVPLRAT